VFRSIVVENPLERGDYILMVLIDAKLNGNPTDEWTHYSGRNSPNPIHIEYDRGTDRRLHWQMHVHLEGRAAHR